MRFPILLAALFISLSAKTQDIIPKPAAMQKGEGYFLLSKATIIKSEQTPANIEFVERLNSLLKSRFGYRLKNMLVSSTTGRKIVNPEIIVDADDYDTLSESYELVVSKNQIRFAGSARGLFYALKTFEQLLPVMESKLPAQSIKIAAVTINDEPRFAYRGMHLDVGRHFFPIAFIKKYIDFLAYHKLNKFHWHLTEDQGWRIEIKRYPELTSIGSKRNGTIIGRYPGKSNDNIPYGGFYTQAEIKEVVQYAKDRFIEVIPEIEMPGHSSAAIAAYPWLSCFPGKPTAIHANMISQKSAEEQKNGRIKLVQETWGVFDDVFCAGNDSTFQFLQNVIDEVTTLFPSNYFHIGGDECPKTHWKICSRCQQRMKELNLKDEHELQSYFVQRIEKYLNSKGKTLIGWDEILEGGLAPNAIVMSWRGEAGGIEAAKQKHQVIMSPGKPVYFDHTQSKNEDSVTIGGYNPIEAVYAYNPVPKELNADESKYVLGAQANVWTEYMNNSKKIEYMIFPRMAALSEVLWSSTENKNPVAIGWDDFEKRLMTQMKRYEMMGLNYSKALYDIKYSIQPSAENNGLEINIGQYKYMDYVKLSKLDYLNGDSILIADKNGKIIGKRKTNEKNIKEETDSTFIITESGSYFLKCGYRRNLINEHALHIGFEKNENFLFTFSKSTGKKITLTTPASNSYPGDGAFTLVNGIINEKGRERSHEFLGFSGVDCEAVIDLGKTDTIRNVTAHIFSQPSTWIWPPSSLTVQTSMDGINFTPVSGGTTPILSENKIQLSFASVATRYVKVFLMNRGIIPEGNSGAGNKAWLFVSEVQVF
jgi:hexosaminidase